MDANGDKLPRLFILYITDAVILSAAAIALTRPMPCALAAAAFAAAILTDATAAKLRKKRRFEDNVAAFVLLSAFGTISTAIGAGTLAFFWGR